jgi:hypothetical protein
MSTIPPVNEDNTISDDATCQEASIWPSVIYVPCGDRAVAIVYQPKDRRSYYMCDSCTDHNVKNRGGQLIGRKPSL